ncbi:MAG: threonine-phosphate decarboxylase [Rhodospirillales bacterium]|nr:MAG: threonine-phosphate decarboxylase [Rhodospirillales bacterium]
MDTALPPAPRRHGGGIDAAAARFGVPRDRWLDLSTGISPIPYPVPALAPEVWQRLPDVGLVSRLKAAAARAYAAQDPGCVAAAPGTQALIQWLPRLLPPSRVAVVSPTYNEHAPAWSAADHDVVAVALGAVPDTAGVVVVVNPNNPDGRVVPRSQLAELGRGRLLVVDEAFADTDPNESMVPDAHHDGLVVLRSFGKFFGLAGLRLGFAVTGPGRTAALEGVLGPWAVSGPAAAIGITALADSDWTASARRRLTDLAERLDAVLAAAGLAIVGGTSLFRLVDDPDAPALYGHLAGRGILTRPLEHPSSWLRIGLPGNDAGFARLEDALSAWRWRRPGAVVD